MVEDLEIIELFLKRSDAAITEIEGKYGRYCYNISHNILHNHQDSEECVNDTWIKTWNSIPPQKPTILSAYLAKIVRNISINIYKKKRAVKRGAGEMNLILDELEECIADKNNVENLLERKEEQNIISEILNKFLWSQKKQNRDMLIRRYFYGDQIGAIAKAFCVSESRVKSLLFRSRGKLGKFLEEEGVHL